MKESDVQAIASILRSKSPKYRIDECPHCGSDEIARVGHFGKFTKSTGKRRRSTTKQDRLYYCHSCNTLIDVKLK